MKNQQERAKAANEFIPLSPNRLYPVSFSGGKVISITERVQARSQPKDDKGKKEKELVRKKRRSINRQENDGLDHLL